MSKPSFIVGIASGFFLYYIGVPYAINHNMVDNLGTGNIWYIIIPTFVAMFITAQHKIILTLLGLLFNLLKFIFSVKTLLRVFILVSGFYFAVEYVIPFTIENLEIRNEEEVQLISVICVFVVLTFSLFMKTIFKLFSMAFKGVVFLWNSPKILGAIFGLKKKKPKEKSVKIPTLEIVAREYKGEQMPAEFYIMQLDDSLRNIIQINQIENQSIEQITSETHL